MLNQQLWDGSRRSRTLLLSIVWVFFTSIVMIQVGVRGWLNPRMQWQTVDFFVFFGKEVGLGLLMIYLYVIPGHDVISRQSSLPLKLLLYLLHGLVYGLVYLALISTFYELRSRGTLDAGVWERYARLLVNDLHNNLKVYLTYTFLLVAMDYFRKMIAEATQNQALENQFDRLRLSTLKGQLEPHFLFNTLNVIYRLIAENPSQAQSALIKLSELLRYSLQLAPEDRISMQEEIENTQKYFDILKARYEDQVALTWDLKGDMQAFAVPPLLLQPLLENAIKHGFKHAETDALVLHIEIEISASERRILLKNPGKLLSASRTKGLGTRLVKERLEALYGKHTHFRLYQQGSLVINEIHIPYAQS